MEKTNKKVIAALGVASVSLSALVGVAVHDATETPDVRLVNVTKTEFINATSSELAEAFAKGVSSVEPIQVPYNVSVPVSFEDEAFKQLACDRLMYDDISECVEEVEAESVALALAVTEIETELAEELDDEDVVKKDSDVRIIEVRSDFEDVTVVKSNFDNDKYVFEIEVKYEDERKEDKETVTVKVIVEDSEAEIVSIN